MDKEFENFWSEYLLERGDYRDDAWENILRRMISQQPLDKQTKIIDSLIDKCIKRQSEYSGWAFETFEELANKEQIDKLKSFTTQCILDDVPFAKYSDLIVLFIKKDFEFIKQTVRQIITTEDFNSLWKYILKNVFHKDQEIFLTGLQRYLTSHDKLGFDIGVFLKQTPGARDLALERLPDYKEYDRELEPY